MAKKIILIAEDEPALRRMLATDLENEGYEVLSAQDGTAALAMVKNSPPDLIITDVLMPNMDGFSFYKELKKSKVTSEIPVLILTARGKMEDSFRVMGADDFVAKPFQSEDLVQKIKLLLGRVKAPEVKQQSGKRVFVAGNDAETVQNIILQLKRVGCHTDLVENGTQVISKAVMFLPQLIIIDVQMEGMSTFENISVLRKMPQFGTTPIVTYSFYRASDLGSEDARQKALSVDADVSNCEDAGATAHLGRFNEFSFLNNIQKYLS